ncbi:MAG: hypothetical protein ACOZAM_23160 [Pseudomonadota bacterium]
MAKQEEELAALRAERQETQNHLIGLTAKLGRDGAGRTLDHDIRKAVSKRDEIDAMIRDLRKGLRPLREAHSMSISRALEGIKSEAAGAALEALVELRARLRTLNEIAERVRSAGGQEADIGILDLGGIELSLRQIAGLQ